VVRRKTNGAIRALMRLWMMRIYGRRSIIGLWNWRAVAFRFSFGLHLARTYYRAPMHRREAIQKILSQGMERMSKTALDIDGDESKVMNTA